MERWVAIFVGIMHIHGSRGTYVSPKSAHACFTSSGLAARAAMALIDAVLSKGIDLGITWLVYQKAAENPNLDPTVDLRDCLRW